MSSENFPKKHQKILPRNIEDLIREYQRTTVKHLFKSLRDIEGSPRTPLKNSQKAPKSPSRKHYKIISQNIKGNTKKQIPKITLRNRRERTLQETPKKPSSRNIGDSDPIR
ncbi:18413_t:CDS:2 [Dentiscutata erythropus]|uniref:18413_t:CDS:1 n=1 Tax=Dentiscutata erythropus TaxID=1348616 RepID=A0A9N8WBA1_9GLOM|nr:18413_t:CDS:2 [Dentiscutata erythropus]